MRALVLIAALTVPVVPASAQAVRDVIASAPVDRSVTVYRAPGRNGGQLDLAQLGGFAVVTETRMVDLPAGEARLAFTGVADGIVAQSALVAGLPGGVIEKNRDDALLSPAALIHAAIGRTVQLRRTNRRTGKVTLTDARIISAGDQGVIFATDQGQEALRCSGQPETFGYTDGGEGLFAQPTLSVLTRSARPVHALITLTYIAENFDWNANYIARISSDGTTLDLTGWITLANGNGVSFANAQTQIVAGGLNRAYLQSYLDNQPRVIARCWPMQRTSDIPETPDQPYQLVHPWSADDQPGRAREEVIVTARRSKFVPSPMMAMAPLPAPPPPPEQLGDLKLYRVPERTTIAARQMKQTRLIDQHTVPFDTDYRVEVQLAPWLTASPPQPATMMLRATNDQAHHLGLPLPAGALLVEQVQGGQIAVLGEPALHDTAQDEAIDLALGPANDITCAWALLPSSKGKRTRQLVITLTNASPHAAPITLRMHPSGAQSISHGSVDTAIIDGLPTAKLSLASGDQRQVVFDLTEN